MHDFTLFGVLTWATRFVAASFDDRTAFRNRHAFKYSRADSVKGEKIGVFHSTLLDLHFHTDRMLVKDFLDLFLARVVGQSRGEFDQGGQNIFASQLVGIGANEDGIQQPNYSSIRRLE